MVVQNLQLYRHWRSELQVHSQIINLKTKTYNVEGMQKNLIPVPISVMKTSYRLLRHKIRTQDKLMRHFVSYPYNSRKCHCWNPNNSKQTNSNMILGLAVQAKEWCKIKELMTQLTSTERRSIPERNDLWQVVTLWHVTENTRWKFDSTVMHHLQLCAWLQDLLMTFY